MPHPRFAVNPSRKGDTTCTKKAYTAFVPELTTAVKITPLQDDTLIWL